MGVMHGPGVTPDFDRTTGSLLLRLRKAAVDLGERAVLYQGKRFKPKDEVHITVIGRALASELVDSAGATEIEEIAALIDQTEWRYVLSNCWYHVVRGGDKPAESIIRMVELPALAAFYSRLEAITGLAIPPRPAHVTLYTWGDHGGIGIATWEEFDERVAGAVDPAELDTEVP